MEHADRLAREHRLAGRTEFSGRLLTLEVDRVRLPGGGEAVREVVRHPGAAVMLPITADGRVVLVRQYRYAVDQHLLELPAGKLDEGESAAECARRELAEETGWLAERMVEIGRFYAAPGFSDEQLWAFVATELQPVQGFQCDADEIIDVVQLAPGELAAAVAAGEIRDAKTLATLLLADRQGHLEL